MVRHHITARISRGAVAHNLRVLRAAIPPGCRLMAVVKSDAYGHGVAGLIETLVADADALAVATIAEAMHLRQLGYAGEILVTVACGARSGGNQLRACAEAFRAGITLTVTDRADVVPLRTLAESMHVAPAIHVKIDTGMGRSGIVPSDAAGLLGQIQRSHPLHLAGVYTHLATSDEGDKSHAEHQFNIFMETLRRAGPLPGAVRHIANSAAVGDLPYMALDAVRPGIALYGHQPSEELTAPLPLRPCLQLTAPIVQIKWLPTGATCGYGRITKLHRSTRIGIVPVGYADGLPRSLSGRFSVGLPTGHAAVLGRISMDQIIIDLTDHPATGVGAEVEIISPVPDSPNSVANLARIAGTIPYELTCRLGRRVNYDVVEDFTPEAIYEPARATHPQSPSPQTDNSLDAPHAH